MIHGFPGLELGQITITYFNLIALAATFAGSLVTYFHMRDEDDSSVLLLNLVFAVLVFGVVFARLFYILNPPPSVIAYYDTGWYTSHPFDLQAGPFAIWSGGLSGAGAVVGISLAIIIVLHRNKVEFWGRADSLILGLLVGAAILPWGNIINEHHYGPPTTAPWGMIVENPVTPFRSHTLFHPTPAYVSILALITLGITVALRMRISDRAGVGGQFLIAVIVYFTGLFALEFLRVDVSPVLFKLTAMQVVAAVYVITAISMFIRNIRKASR